MRTLNGRFAAGLILTVLTLTVSVFVLHRFQYRRISRDLVWQIDHAREAGHPASAIAQAYRYLEFCPDDIEMYVRLAGWIEERPGGGRKQGASVVALLEKALRLDPTRADIRRRVVALDLRLRQYGECLDHLDYLLTDNPQDAELLTWLGEARQRTGKHSQAAQAYERALKIDPTRIATVQAYADLLARQLRRPDDARRCLETAVRGNPTSIEARVALARFFHQTGLLADAQRFANEAVELGPANLESLVIAGEISHAAGSTHQAREYFQRACDVDPKNARLACTLARLLLFEGQTDEAAQHLRAILRDAPDNVDALTTMGDVLAFNGRLDDLQRIIDELAAVRSQTNGRSWNVDYLKARWLMRRGEWAAAAAMLNELRAVAARAPGIVRQANFLLAQCYEQLGDHDNELAAFRRLFESDPSSGFVRLEFARGLARAGQFEEAIAEIAIGVQQSDLSPQYVGATVAEVVERAQRGHAENALRSLERLLASVRGTDPTNVVLAKIHVLRLRNQAAGALALADECVSKRPSEVTLLAARARILDALYGSARSLESLDESQKRCGDQPDFRIARLQVFASTDDANLSRDTLAKFSHEGRTRVIMELIAHSGATGNIGQLHSALELLRADRPDHVGVRSVLLTRVLAANDRPAMELLLLEIAQIEGAMSYTARRFNAERLVRAAQHDETVLAAARAALAELAQVRPNDPMLEFFQGRLEEAVGSSAATEHYTRALDLGLLDQPIEEQLGTLWEDGSRDKVKMLIEESPLIERLRLEQDRAVVPCVLALVSDVGRAKAADRLLESHPEATPPQLLWLSRCFQQMNLTTQAETAVERALALAPRSVDAWAAKLRLSGKDNPPGLSMVPNASEAAAPKISVHE
ncbi:MAG: tetratricopeptide repeat protein [Gemmataceae bacterium]